MFAYWHFSPYLLRIFGSLSADYVITNMHFLALFYPFPLGVIWCLSYSYTYFLPLWIQTLVRIVGKVVFLYRGKLSFYLFRSLRKPQNTRHFATKNKDILKSHL